MNKIGDISAEERNEPINHEEKADVGEKLDISSEEKELLAFLLFKNREKENALNIVLNCKPERGAEFYTPILDLKTKALNDIDKIDGEVTKKLKDYLSSKSDEEKYYVAELLNKQGLQDFIVKNLEEFGEKFNKELSNELVKKGNGQDVVKNLDKFEGLDKEIAKKLIEKGDPEKLDQYANLFKGLDGKK